MAGGTSWRKIHEPKRVPQVRPRGRGRSRSSDRIALPELLATIDFDRLSAGFQYPDLGVSTRPVELPRLDGMPRDIVFVRKIFGMKKDRAIIPHGHRNMTSCHYVLKGELELKQYDKLEEDATHMVIEPTIHEIARAGSHSSISDEKNNIHWLRATTQTASPSTPSFST